jgi:hypothetical protein
MSDVEDYIEEDGGEYDEGYSEEQGEIVFKTDIAGEEHKSWWRLLPAMAACGALIGLFGWYQFDGDVSVVHLAAWAGGGAVVLSCILLLPFFREKGLEEVRVFEEGFRVVDKGFEKEYAWGDLEAAHFEKYPVVNMGTEIQCFEFRANGRNVQLMIDGMGKDKVWAFAAVMNSFLEEKGIAKEAPKLRSFAYHLSQAAVGVFVVSIVLIVIGHLFVFHTLGTIIGASLMFAGAGLACFSWRQGLSKLVLAATVMVIVGVVVYVNVFDVNVRETLLEWEERERELDRPPWSQTQEVEPKQQGDE